MKTSNSIIEAIWAEFWSMTRRRATQAEGSALPGKRSSGLSLVSQEQESGKGQNDGSQD